MQLRITLAAVFTLFFCTITTIHAAGNTTTSETTDNSCFGTCAATAATEVGCTDISDASCWCTKEQFATSNAQCTLKACPDLANNSTVALAVFVAYQRICEKAVGDALNQTVPLQAQLSLNATTTTNASGTTTARESKKDGALSLQPPLAHVMSACLVLSAFVAGSSLLL